MNLYPLEIECEKVLPELLEPLRYTYSLTMDDNTPQVLISITEEDDEGYLIPYISSTIPLALAYYLVNAPDDEDTPYYNFKERTIEIAETELILQDASKILQETADVFTMFLELVKGVTYVV